MKEYRQQIGIQMIERQENYERNFDPRAGTIRIRKGFNLDVDKDGVNS